jgi:hypothetical protein
MMAQRIFSDLFFFFFSFFIAAGSVLLGGASLRFFKGELSFYPEDGCYEYFLSAVVNILAYISPFLSDFETALCYYYYAL